MKKKVNDLVRLHKAIEEKLKTASYSGQIQILALVPDKWSFVRTSHEIKKVGGILIKSAPKREKLLPLKCSIW